MTREFDQIPEKLLRDLGAAPIVPEEEIDAYTLSRGSHSLSKPELAALLLLSHGLTSQMAGDLLHKSSQTIATQLKTARYKLRAKNTSHAIGLALRAGLID